jgi:uncharacterized protein (TIGR02594 family)
MMPASPYDIARRFLGIGEIAGPTHHPFVQFCHSVAGLGIEQPDETAWCGSFVSTVAWIAGIELPGKPARARSWLKAGHAVLVGEARPGWDIVIITRGTGEQPGPDVLDAPGHVGFYAGRTAAGAITLLGGNQGDVVSFATFPASRVLGIRRLS